MFEFIIFAALLTIISLIFTLNKQSKLKKFLIFFIALISFLACILGVFIYIESINSAKRHEERQNQRKQIQELWAKEVLKINVEFNVEYPNNIPLQVNSIDMAKVTGRIINNSSILLKDFSLKYTIKDCVAECIIIEQDTQRLGASIPSLQARDFMFFIGYGKQIQFKGTPKLEIKIEKN